MSSLQVPLNIGSAHVVSQLSPVPPSTHKKQPVGANDGAIVGSSLGSIVGAAVGT
eukprot:CAMPEP_0175028594 /NCGR_PEP_ID=MMETSP0005-20121125/19096_1 /TAXON_ID=420556 /ORGANISM="Ochromonas sp., Strain CCMP1393" /LENGTH=54 /DNA_ID=CAMNT_0016288249 /DNA_START=19 /DNA_END=180 /DNA_ORIENTATION=+